jgi:riboflavin kinase/FMN adenylyltransferase
MKLRRLCHAGRPGAGCVMTIGGYDGLHLGHQALIARTRAIAAEKSLPAALLSFEPLPREFLAPENPPARLTNFRERWRLLASMGVDEFCVLRFDQRLRSFSGTEFMALLRDLGASHIVVGHDFRFGRGGEGSAQWCQAEAASFGFGVEVVSEISMAGVRVGSRLVREALASGDLGRARELLGRGYSMRGRVQRGAQLGRTLGFPTANLAVKRRRVPLTGIFAVRVNAAGAPAANRSGAPAGAPLVNWPGVASLGTRPQVGGGAPLLEAHLFDFDGNLYGRELEVEFVAKLRDEATFASLELMTEQMHRDAQAARRALAQ